MSTAEERQHIETLVEDITSTGLVTLDDSQLKQLKTACRKSDACLRFAFDRIWRQLTKDHAQIRYSCVKVIDALFQRSHLFRQLLLEDVQDYFTLTIALDPTTRLPKPKSTARMLRRQTLIFFKQWHDKFHTQHKKLVLGYKFLQSNGGIDFDDLGEDAGMSAVERQRARDKARAEEAKAQELYDRATREIADQWDSVVVNLNQLESSVDLVREQRLRVADTNATAEDGDGSTSTTLPGEGKVADSEKGGNNEEADGEGSSINSTGSKNRSGSADPPVDAPVMSAVKEHDRVLRYKHVQMVNAWVDALVGAVRYQGNPANTGNTQSSSSGGHSQSVVSTGDQSASRSARALRARGSGRDTNTGTRSGTMSPTSQPTAQATLRRCVELQVRCQALLKTVVEMGIDVSPPKRRSLPVTVLPDKESALTADQKEERARDEAGWSVFSYARDRQKREPTERHIRHTLEQQLSLHAEDEETRLRLLKDKGKSKAIDPAAQVFKAPARTTDTGKAVRIKEGVPIMPYDTDLEYWESKTVPINVGLVDDIDHRFWSSSERVGEVDASIFRTRVRYHENEFVPVKWACRAPMPNGKLCARHDRKKCPLHGPVIARDSQGEPNGQVQTDSTALNDGNGGKKSSVTNSNASGSEAAVADGGVYARFANLGNNKSGTSTSKDANRDTSHDEGQSNTGTGSGGVEKPLWETVAQEMGITMPTDGSELLQPGGKAGAQTESTGRDQDETTSHDVGSSSRGRGKRKAVGGGDRGTDKTGRKTAKKESNLAKVKDDIELSNERRRRRLFRGRLYEAAVKLDIEEQKKHADKFGNQWQYY